MKELLEKSINKATYRLFLARKNGQNDAGESFLGEGLAAIDILMYSDLYKAVYGADFLPQEEIQDAIKTVATFYDIYISGCECQAKLWEMDKWKQQDKRR